MSPLVLTGATGFLGGAVLNALEARGELAGTVALTRRPAPELGARGVEVREGSLFDAGWVAEQLDPGCRIIHIAGRIDFEAGDAKVMHDLHVEATRALAAAALRIGCARFVLLSSSGTTAVSQTERMHDETAAYPVEIIERWPYYLSKMLQERLVLDLHHRAGLPAVVLNPSLILGPGEGEARPVGVVDDFLARRIPVVPPGGISMVDVRDAAAAVISALERGRVGERYFLTALNCRFRAFFQLLEACSGVPAPRLPLPRRAGLLGTRLIHRFGRAWRPELAAAISPARMDMASHFWYASSRKATRELGFAPRTPERTLRDTLAFIRSAPTSTVINIP